MFSNTLPCRADALWSVVGMPIGTMKGRLAAPVAVTRGDYGLGALTATARRLRSA